MINSRFFITCGLFIALFCAGLQAQAPDTLWTKIYDGYDGVYFEETDDGGFIVLGSYRQIDYTCDIYLVKTDANGDTIWTGTYGRELADRPVWVHQTSDRGYFIVGWSISSDPYNEDVLVIKTDSLGHEIWTKVYGGPANEFVHRAHETSDGGCIIVANTESYGNGSYDLYLLRLNADGDTLWTKTYGGTLYDIGYSATQTPDGGFFVTGNLYFDRDDYYYFTLIKTDANGDSLWTKFYGISSGSARTTIIPTSDGNYMIQKGPKLYKINELGDTLWTNSFNTSDPDEEISTYGIAQASDGGYVICGQVGIPWYEHLDVYAVKTDSLGDTTWTQRIIGEESVSVSVAECIAQTSDGNFVLVGSISVGNEVNKLLLAKIESGLVGIDNKLDFSLPNQYRLYQNYPNPFNANTVISYRLPEPGNVKIDIFDIQGRKLQTLIDEYKQAGMHRILYDGSDFASGYYFYRLQAGDYSESKKLTLIK
jgi:hypothetical protein